MSEQGSPIVACPECGTKVRLPANIAPGDELACPNCSAEIPHGAAAPPATASPKTVLPPPPERAVKLDIDGLVVRDSVAIPAAFDSEKHTGPDFDHPEKLASTDDEEFATDGQEEPRQRIMRPEERRQIVGWDEDSADLDPSAGGAPPVAAAASLKFFLIASPFVIAAIVFAIVARPKKLDKTPAPPPALDEEQIAAATGDGQETIDALEEMPRISKMRDTFGADRIYALASECLTRFLNADGIEERLRHCRAKERVRPLMETYYATRDAGAIPFRDVTKNDLIDNYLFLEVEMEDFSTQPAVLVPNDDLDGFEVDWESFVTYGEMTLRQFTAEKPTSPVLMRLVAVADDYFNFGFSEETYVCFRFDETPSDDHIYGYAPRDSPVAEELSDLVNGNPQGKFVVVRLKFPKDAEIRNQAIIEEIVEKGWVIE